MRKGSKIIPLISWILVIVVTALVYCLLVDDIFSSAVKVMSVAFVLLAEAILCVKFLARKQSIIMNTQLIFSGMYLAVVMILSFIYVNVDAPNVKLFIAIHAVLLVLLTVTLLGVFNINKRVERSNGRLEARQSVVSEMCVLANDIIAENGGSELANELGDIAEALKYCDNSKLCGNEEEISVKLEELKASLSAGAEVDAVKAQITDIKILLKKRENYIKQNQRGNF